MIYECGQWVHPHESNFMWSDFGVIAELKQGTVFMWRPYRDHHGTTLNRVLCDHPKDWKGILGDTEKREAAQITTAWVLTDAGRLAASRLPPEM
jgi:hypothetical protein